MAINEGNPLYTETAPAEVVRAGKAITAWWTIRNSTGDVEAIVIVYVDDFMICGPRNLVEELSEAIQKVWDTSELTFLGHESSVRFLGMELHRAQETHDEIFVQQHGYISELLRLHGVKETQLDKVPITKDLAVIPEVPEGADELLIREAQQLTGEILWVTQRTRPDLAFTSSLMDGAFIEAVGNRNARAIKIYHTDNSSFNVKAHSSGIQLDYDSVGILMILLMILGAMMIWEGAYKVTYAGGSTSEDKTSTSDYSGAVRIIIIWTA
ncbi:TY5A, partial [Symbiodinium microadriaticum]